MKRSGASASCLVAFLAVLLPGTGLARADGARVVVELTAEGEAAVPEALILRLEPAGGDGEAREVQATAGRAEVALPPGSAWRVRVDDDAWWTPPGELQASGSPWRVPVRPAAFVEGTLAVEDGPLPDEIGLRGAPAWLAPDRNGLVFLTPERRREGRFEDRCVVATATGRFRCKVPATALDLRFRSPGFVSHYRWGLDPEPETVEDVGRLRLEAGASVVGWVGGRFPVRDATVVLYPELEVGETVEGERQRDTRKLAGRPDERGFFHLQGVPLGLYRLEVRHPEAATATVRPIRIQQAAEHEVPPVELSPPGELRVRVLPPEGPGDEPWNVVLHDRAPAVGGAYEIAAQPTEEPGVYRSRGLAAGAYEVRVQSADGSIWGAHPVTVPGSSASDGAVTDALVDLDLVELEGIVTFGGEPLGGAELWLGGRHQVPRIRLRSDEDGEFTHLAPRRKSWDVRVESRRPSVVVEKLIPVETTPDEGRGRVTVEIPATRLEGVARLPDGTAPPRLSLWAWPAEGGPPGSWHLRLDDGRFAVQGLEESGYTLVAEYQSPHGRRFEAPKIAVTMSEETSPVEIEVELREHRPVIGALVDEEGRPVPRGEVFGFALDAQGEVVPPILDAAADADGRVELRVSERARAVRVVTFALGRRVAVHWATLEDDRFTVPVGTGGGTLIVEGLGLYEEPGDPFPLVYVGDFHLTGTHLHRWARAHGQADPQAEGHYRLPGFAPGSYTVCRATGRSRERREDLPCTGGTLTEGGELRLVMPGAAAR